MTNKMKYLIYILLFLFFGCASKKSNIISYEEEIKKQLIQEISKGKEKEKEIAIYKDSIYYMRGLVEKSSYFGTDSSFLETSYSESFAKVDTLGKLNHTLKNKDSIPSIVKYKYLYRDIKITDTIIVSKVDALYQNKNLKETVYIKPTFREKIKLSIVGGLILLLIGFLIKRTIKKYL